MNTNLLEIVSNIRGMLTPIKNIFAIEDACTVTKTDTPEYKSLIEQAVKHGPGARKALENVVNELTKISHNYSWVTVNSYKDLPLNTPVIVKVANDSAPNGFVYQIGENSEKMPMIGHYFAWDCNKVIAYKKIE